MTEKVRHVFEDNELRFMITQYPAYLIEQVTPPLVIKPPALPRLAKGLAWETCAKDIMLWNVRFCYCCDITTNVHTWEINIVK